MLKLMNSIGKPIFCQAAVCHAIAEPLRVEKIRVDPPKAKEIRVQMVATGICKSDISVLETNLGNDFKFPLIAGHEGAGIVESVGEGVTDFKVGDHVIPLWVANCGECDFCQSSKTNLCKNRKREMNNVMADGTSRFFTESGNPIYKTIGTATFSEYTVLREEAAVRIPKEADLEKVCLIGCCIVTGFGNVINVVKVEPGSTVGVWGLGAIGLAVAVACKNLGATRIIGVDTNEDKFEIAKKFGCTEFVNPLKTEEAYKAKTIQEYFQSIGGLDYSFECVGYVSAMQSAFESLKPYGTCAILGLSTKGNKFETDPWLFLQGRKLTGSFMGGYKPKEGIELLTKEYIDGKIPQLKDFVSNTMSLSQINEAIDMFKKGKVIRTVIKY